MATRTLYLVRHGEHDSIDYSPLGPCPTTEERLKHATTHGGLTLRGKQQAMLVARRLEALPITAIYSSSLLRAAETAEYIATAFPDTACQRTSALWECVPCLPPAPRDEPYRENYSADELNAQGQHADDAFHRFFKPARGDDKHEILVCHGNLIRYFIARVLNAPPENLVFDLELCNCSISEVLVKPDGNLLLIALNDVGFMPYHLMTCLGARKFTARQMAGG